MEALITLTKYNTKYLQKSNRPTKKYSQINLKLMKVVLLFKLYIIYYLP